MKFKGREKYFWERYFQIKNSDDLPSEIGCIRGIDSEHDDEFFYFISLRVGKVERIDLRCSQVTDEGVKHIAHLKTLKELRLKDHRSVTKACLPDLNQLKELECLDLSKTSIAPEDLYQLTQLKKLQQLIISTDKAEEEFAPELEKLNAHFPGCSISVY